MVSSVVWRFPPNGILYFSFYTMHAMSTLLLLMCRAVLLAVRGSCRNDRRGGHARSLPLNFAVASVLDLNTCLHLGIPKDVSFPETQPTKLRACSIFTHVLHSYVCFRQSCFPWRTRRHPGRTLRSRNCEWRTHGSGGGVGCHQHACKFHVSMPSNGCDIRGLRSCLAWPKHVVT